jgi:uncharacterized integral membrane protein
VRVSDEQQQQPPADETPAPEPEQPAEEQRAEPPRHATRKDDPLRRSKTSMLWLSTVGLGIVLTLLIVLILQNTQEVKVSFLWWEGTPPLAAALLIAAAGGILLTAIAGSLRIMQLRRRVKRR